jgi:hypothetical protein
MRGHAAAARISASVSEFVHTAMLWMLPRNVFVALALEEEFVLQAITPLAYFSVPIMNVELGFGETLYSAGAVVVK